MTNFDSMADIFSDAIPVHCPNCNGEMVHPVELLVVRGDVWHKLTERGALSGSGLIRATRGVVIEETYWCEDCGAQWVEREQFHKGNTYRAARQILPNPEYDGATIWRD